MDRWMSSVDRVDPNSVEEFVSHVEREILTPLNHFLIKVKSHLIMLYSLLENRDDMKARRDVLERRVQLCQEVMRYEHMYVRT